jgi:photosystem II stability/assembly factor-like uncharacterized protein
MTMKKLFVLTICLFLAACAGKPVATEPVPTEALAPTQEIINLPLVDSPQLTQIHFFNETDGWGVTESQVVRTNDGGVTWFNATPAVSVQFGYALYHTTDGGTTWDSGAVPFAYANLQFLDSNNGFALAALGAGAGSEAVALYQTSDAGTNWTRVFINDPTEPGANDSLPLGGQKYGFTFLDSSRGWVGGSVPVDNYIYLYRTTDGGITWSEVGLALPTSNESVQTGTSGPQFFSATDGILIVNLVMSSAPGLATVIYRTSDGGETWTPGQVIPSGRPANFSTFLDGVAWGGGQFYRTNDAGQSWTAFTPGEDFTAMLGSFQFVSPLVGWVLTTNEASDPSLYGTTDGGTTWTLLIP